MAISRIEFDFSLASRSELTLEMREMIMIMMIMIMIMVMVMMMIKIPVNTELFMGYILRSWLGLGRCKCHTRALIITRIFHYDDGDV